MTDLDFLECLIIENCRFKCIIEEIWLLIVSLVAQFQNQGKLRTPLLPDISGQMK